jgi:hypothetical protein
MNLLGNMGILTHGKPSNRERGSAHKCTSGNLSYFYCGGIAAGLQQNFITFSLHLGVCRIAVGLQKKRLHFHYIYITLLQSK